MIDEIGFRTGIVSAVIATDTILSTSDDVVILVADADDDKSKSNEAYVRMLVGKDRERFKLILLQPEIESLFFSDKNALEAALGQKIPDMVWEIGMSAPKSTLSALLGRGKKADFSKLLSSIPLLSAMRNHPKIKEIQEFAQVAHA
ncbi:MAG: hypothetical protein IPN95_26555 [Bacteroidetes bacterium]|nr:hypothetical protein [Bacteroidota bacterium]